MSEERSAKLKLKRKKCVTTAQGGQEVEVKLQPSSALSSRQDFTGSWFDEIELTAAERIWKQVLSCAYPDLRSVSWGAVPSLPDVNLKVNRKEKETTNTEEIKVGDVSLKWDPLPTALTTDKAETPRVPEINVNQHNIEQIKKPLEDTAPENIQQRKSSVLVTKQGEIPVCGGDSKRNTEDLPPPQNSSTRNVMLPLMSQKSTTESVTKSRTLLKSSSRNLSESQISHKGSSKTAKEPQTSQKGFTKQQTSQKPITNLWATVKSTKPNKVTQDYKRTEEPNTEEKPQPNNVMMDAAEEGTSGVSSGGHKMKEPAEKSTDATSSLDTCPICLMQFPKQFSQLDMDSHLAQCLSETTVDVVW